MRREISVRMEDVTSKRGREGMTYVLLGENDEGHWVHVLEAPPGYESEAHFHDYDQFQVVIKGSIDMAGEVLTPGSVHYTDAKTPYGPFKAGPGGLHHDGDPARRTEEGPADPGPYRHRQGQGRTEAPVAGGVTRSRTSRADHRWERVPHLLGRCRALDGAQRPGERRSKAGDRASMSRRRSRTWTGRPSGSSTLRSAIPRPT